MLRYLPVLSLTLPIAATAACPLTTPREVLACVTDHVAEYSPGDISELASRLLSLEEEAARGPGVRVVGARIGYDSSEDPAYWITHQYGEGFVDEVTFRRGGEVELRFRPGAFSAPPVCSGIVDPYWLPASVVLWAPTTSEVLSIGLQDEDGITNAPFEVLCVGPT